MSLQSSLGLVLGSLRSLTIGLGGWRLIIIVLRNSFLAGPSIDREAGGSFVRR